MACGSTKRYVWRHAGGGWGRRRTCWSRIDLGEPPAARGPRDAAAWGLAPPLLPSWRVREPGALGERAVGRVSQAAAAGWRTSLRCPRMLSPAPTTWGMTGCSAGARISRRSGPSTSSCAPAAPPAPVGNAPAAHLRAQCWPCRAGRDHRAADVWHHHAAHPPPPLQAGPRPEVRETVCRLPAAAAALANSMTAYVQDTAGDLAPR